MMARAALVKSARLWLVNPSRTLGAGARLVHELLSALHTRTRPRGHCWKCGAIKYHKYLNRVRSTAGRGTSGRRWECRNAAKCKNRGADYRV